MDWLLGYAVRLEYGDNGKCLLAFLTKLGEMQIMFFEQYERLCALLMCCQFMHACAVC